MMQGERMGGCHYCPEERAWEAFLLRERRSEGLLGGVDHVEEAVLVPLALVDLGDGGGDGDHAVAVHQQEEGLVGVQLQAPPVGGNQTKHSVSASILTRCYF